MLPRIAVLLGALAAVVSAQLMTAVQLPSAVCNDGSPAIFYIAANSSSGQWVIRLEGGGACFNTASCQQRWNQTQVLMSSKSFAPSMTGSGILSANCTVNPGLCWANRVHVPYCSSDLFSGTGTRDGWIFDGNAIVAQTMSVLTGPNYSLAASASQVLLTGDSAGGISVLGQADRVAAAVRAVNPRAKTSGLVDSGWFLDETPIKPQPCIDNIDQCTEQEYIGFGTNYWTTLPPPACAAAQPTNATWWHCYMGYHAHPFIQTPLMVFQFNFDAAQLAHDAIGWSDLQTNATVLKYALAEAQELHTVTVAAGVVAMTPSCYFHTIIGFDFWIDLKVGGTSLPQLLQRWLHMGSPSTGVVLDDSCPTPDCNPTCPNNMQSAVRTH